MADELKKLRSRWRRWLGQMTKDENYTRLLDSNLSGWMRSVCRAHDVTPGWRPAIDNATLDELRLLDVRVLEEKARR